MAENREKRERVKCRLERQKRLAQEKLKEEQEKEELARMQRQIREINRKRSDLHAVKFRHDKSSRGRAPKFRSPVKVRTNTNVHNRNPVKRKVTLRKMTAKQDKHGKPDTLLNNKKQKAQEKVAQWLQSSVESESDVTEVESMSDDDSDDTKVDSGSNCAFTCFSRRNMRDTWRGARPPETSQPEIQKSERVEKKRKQTTKKDGNEGGHVSRSLTVRMDRETDGESEIMSISSKSCCSSVNSRRITHHNVKSGFLEKPCSNVLIRHKWPHMNQDPRYVTEFLSFNELNFCQFVGRECCTILHTESHEEVVGRLRILSKIAYLYNQCNDWDRARSTYFAIIGSIEEDEATWTSSFGHYDLMCPATFSEKKGEKRGESRQNNPRSRMVQKKEFFCKDYQKMECTQSPHTKPGFAQLTKQSTTSVQCVSERNWENLAMSQGLTIV